MPSLPADPLFLTELISTLVAEAEAPAAELEALGERGIRVLTL